MFNWNKNREPKLDFNEYDAAYLRRRSVDDKWSNPYFDQPVRIRKKLGNGRFEVYDLYNQRMRGGVDVKELKPCPEELNSGDRVPAQDEFYVKKIVNRIIAKRDDGTVAPFYRLRWRGRPSTEDLKLITHLMPPIYQKVSSLVQPRRT